MLKKTIFILRMCRNIGKREIKIERLYAMRDRLCGSFFFPSCDSRSVIHSVGVDGFSDVRVKIQRNEYVTG